MITRTELFHAQIALTVAVALQIFVLWYHTNIPIGPQYFIIVSEIGMVLLLAITLLVHTTGGKKILNMALGSLLCLISLGNLFALGLVLYALTSGNTAIGGIELLLSALAVLITNIIVFALWYWEIDSPGLTSHRWSKNDKDFQFTQQNHATEFTRWRPQFSDYLYLSVTNAINFAPADTKPLTHAAKFLMASQALISLTTLALVVSRSISLIG